MPLQDVRLQSLQTLPPHPFLPGGLLPTYILDSPWLLSCDQAGHPMLEPSKRLDYAGGHYPHLRPKEKNHLNHLLKEHS